MAWRVCAEGEKRVQNQLHAVKSWVPQRTSRRKYSYVLLRRRLCGTGIRLGARSGLADKTPWRAAVRSYCQLYTKRIQLMQLTDFVRGVPDDIWSTFDPILPAVVWKGNGRKPKDNRQCFHALLYVLAAGIAWEMLPLGFPSYKTVQRRLKVWLTSDLFHRAWQQLAQRYERLHCINLDQILPLLSKNTT